MTRAFFGLFATLMLQASTIMGSDTLLLPMEKVEAAGQECDTCFEPYQLNGGLFPLQFPCKHYFCVECLRDWISVQLKQRSNKLRCPMCNHEYCIDAVQESFLAHSGERHFERGKIAGEELEKYMETYCVAPSTKSSDDHSSYQRLPSPPRRQSLQDLDKGNLCYPCCVTM